MNNSYLGQIRGVTMNADQGIIISDIHLVVEKNKLKGEENQSRESFYAWCGWFFILSSAMHYLFFLPDISLTMV
jgi:hypothetical protein